MVRIAEHDTHCLEAVAGLEADGEFVEERIQVLGLQETHLAALRTAHFGLVARNLRRQLIEPTLRSREFGFEFLSSRHGRDS